MTADAPTSAGFERGDRGVLDLRPGKIHRFAAELAQVTRPKICVLTQATGDPIRLIGAFYAAFARTEFEMSHLQLFPMPNVDDIRGHLLGQDIIWVDGGSRAAAPAGDARAQVVADRAGPRGYELRRAADGTVTGTPLPTRVL